MAVWEIELSDGRVIDVESENEPDERAVMSALQEFEPEQSPPPLEAFSSDVSRSMTPDGSVSAIPYSGAPQGPPDLPPGHAEIYEELGMTLEGPEPYIPGGVARQAAIGAQSIPSRIGEMGWGAAAGAQQFAMSRVPWPLSKLIPDEDPVQGFLQRRMAEKGEQVEDYETIGAATKGPRIVRDVVGTAGSIVPSLAAAPAGFAAMVGAAGMQSYGHAYSEAKKKGMTDDQAQVDALVKGSITAAVTRGFGVRGLEVLASGVKRAPVRNKLTEILKQAGFESTEETLDETLQMAYDVGIRNEDLTPEDALYTALVASIAGGLFGGGAATVNVANQMIEKRQMAAPVAKAIDELSKNLTVTPQGVFDSQGRPIRREGSPDVPEGIVTDALKKVEDVQAKQQRVRQQEEAVAARREGRPVVPEGPPAPARVSVIQEIRQQGADTVAKIQELFPQAKLSREQARELRKIAYPPQQPTTGEPSASQVQQAAEIHGDVRQQPVEGQGQVPAEVGGAEVQPEAVTPPRPGGGRSTMEARLREAEAREAQQAPVQQVPAQHKLSENYVVNQDTGAAVAEDLGLRWDGVRTEAGKRKLQFTITEPGPFQGTTFQVGPTVNVGMVKKAIQDKATPEVAGFTKSEKFKGNHELSMEGGELTADFRGKGPIKLEMLNVDPAAQGAGVGSRLMSVLKNTADAQGRGVTLVATAIDPSKQAALNRFYERQGFEKSGTDKDTGKPIYTREAGKTEAVEPAPVEAVSQQLEPTYPLRTREGGGLEDAEGRPVDAQHRLIERPTEAAPVEPAPVESAPVMEPMEMSVGPGAASLAEFAQRIRRAEAAAPPPSDGPVSVPGGETPTPEVIRKENDYHIFNVFNSGQWSFYFGRLGENAQEAWSDMALTEFKMRENIARDLQLFRDDILEMLPRAYRKKGGEPFFNAILFKRMPEIEAQFAGKKGGENLVEAARRLKTRLEEIRTTMRDIKRNSYRKFLSNLDKDTVAELFKQNIADPEGRLKGDMADALVMDQYPDDVWFSDGSYLPQLFFGTWKVTVTLKGDKQSQFVTRAETEAQASAEIFNLTRNHPEYKDANFKIEQDTVITPDMIRIGDRAFWDMIGRMKKEALEGVNVKDAVRGIVGRKAGKQKRWGSLLQRMGYAGFSRNFHQTMTAYLSGFHRWKELSALQSRVQPKIEAVRREGRPQAANRLDEIMEYLWGKPHKSTALFDNFIATVPFLRNYVKPLALARFSRNIRMLARHGMLLTVRYSVVNRLQPIQGLYPMVGERIITQAKIMQHSAAGKKLLDEAGVSFDPGMTRTVGAPIKPRDILGVMTGERSNQEIAFLAMYQHGIESGLSHADAIKYGKLRGQLMTQFTPLITDEAPILSGPILSAMFQFKRFPMKQLELAAIMRRNKMYPGLIRMLLGFFLVGGASFFLGQTWQNKRKQKKLKDALDEGVGDKAADAVMYGLPGLLGADISGSIVLFDEPYGRDFYSKLGRTLTGPAISAPMEITRAALTEPRQPMESSEKARVILNRIPSLRPVANLWALLDEDVDVRSPSGEVRYRRALSEVIAGFGGFRTARESNEAASIDAIMEIEQEGRELKNRFYVSAAGDGDVEGVLEDIQKFNQRWPEYGITMESLSQYVKQRVKEAGKTRGERIAGPRRQHLIDQ